MKEKKDMKKLAFVLALVMCIGLLAAPAAAVSSKGSYGKVPLYKGAITIDGKIDDIYKKGLLIDLAGKFPGNYGGDTTGKAYVLHDGANIYLAIEVDNKYPLGEYTDALANFGTGYKETAAELYFDWKDDGASSMKWIAWADAKSQIFEKDDNAEKGLVKGYKATSDAAKKTYIMEYKIQLASGVKTGSNVGWCVMLNANTDPKNPKQEKIAIPTKLNNINVANKPAEWLSFTLDSTEIKVEAPKAPAASAATADPAILAVVSLAAATGAAFISKKRK